MEINLIIRELLAKHDYISLPGIGSFTQTYEPAFPSADGKSFIPPKQVISFDTSRTFNDEAIENYLCDKMGITHAEAANMLKVYVDKVNYNLDKGRPVVFENVGELFKNKKGRLKFEQAQDNDTALATYGLKPIEVEQVSSKKVGKLKEIKTSAKNDSNSKTSSVKILVVFSAILGVAAISAVFVFFPEFHFWEKYLNKNQVAINSNSDSLNKLAGNKEQAVPVNSTLSKKDSIQEKVDKSITDKNVKKAALYYGEPKVQEGKTYYIIVGSFGKIENAQKLVDKYKERGYNPEIIKGNNMFRVSISRTTDKNKSLFELNKFKTDNPSESAWILGI
ncbi:MAG TPA: hypothetical protein DIW31_01820 [Bacteroidales bacterium]|nr:hypothetical protein [Bacteroidales bacterium]